MGIAVGKQGLESALDRHKIVLAIFYADWCGVCRRLLEEALPRLENEFAAKESLFVAEILIEHQDQELANEELVEEYVTRGEHPLAIVFCNKKEVAREKCWGNKEEQYESVRELLLKAVKKRRDCRYLSEIQMNLQEAV